MKTFYVGSNPYSAWRTALTIERMTGVAFDVTLHGEVVLSWAPDLGLWFFCDPDEMPKYVPPIKLMVDYRRGIIDPSGTQNFGPRVKVVPLASH